MSLFTLCQEFTAAGSLIQAEAPRAVQPKAAPLTRPYPRRALIVDDEDAIRGLLRAYMELDGYQVETAVNGEEGIRMFRAGDFDLVITDRQMPVMDGCELARAVKAQEPHVPVVLVSGSPACTRHLPEDPSPIDVVVTKPCTLPMLREAIATAQRAHECEGIAHS